ncbi:hypothetical protein ACERK3_01175 [Phycisphaerales bacterium AB-hyl4]|uniref:Lipoprotein n=1 Tax=Natronomicrosphaera hydrolytica TaxID=3242702 RepID=A0ABV4U238_9BACT
MLPSTTGCQITVGGERTVGQENDRLRAENLSLRRQNRQLQEQVDARDDQVQGLRERISTAQDAPAIEGVDPPQVARLSFSRISGPVDLDGDDRHDVIRIYLQTQDQHGRILPVAGRATVRAIHLTDEGESQIIAMRVYEPAELDAAWRHNFTGIHYTLELPLPETLPTGTTELTVHVSLLEAQTGARLTRQEAMTVRR